MTSVGVVVASELFHRETPASAQNRRVDTRAFVRVFGALDLTTPLAAALDVPVIRLPDDPPKSGFPPRVFLDGTRLRPDQQLAPHRPIEQQVSHSLPWPARECARRQRRERCPRDARDGEY